MVETAVTNLCPICNKGLEEEKCVNKACDIYWKKTFDVWEVAIRIRIDKEINNKPDKWNWERLLDFAGDEYAYVLATDFIGNAADEWLEDGADPYAPESNR